MADRLLGDAGAAMRAATAGSRPGGCRHADGGGVADRLPGDAWASTNSALGVLGEEAGVPTFSLGFVGVAWEA